MGPDGESSLTRRQQGRQCLPQQIDIHGQGELVGWLTEARQIVKTIPGRLDIYRSELTKTMGPDLGDGDVYAKARTVYEIMRQLLSTLRRENSR